MPGTGFFPFTNDLYVDANQKNGEALVMPGFANITANGVIDNITEEFYEENIYAGTVRVAQEVSSRDYVVVTGTYEGELSFKPASTPCYVLTYSDTKGYDVVEQEEAFVVGERLIVVTDDTTKHNVLYVINVDQSVYTSGTNKGEILEVLYENVSGVEDGLYIDIKNDAEYEEYTVTVVNHVTGLTATLAADTTDPDAVLTNNNDGTYSVTAGAYILTVSAAAGETNEMFWVTDDSQTAIGDYTDASWAFSVTVSDDMIIEITGETTTETFMVTVNDANNDNAAVSGGVDETSGTSVAYNGSVTFTVEADSGYQVTGVAISDESNGSLTDNGDGSYTISNITADQEITVTTARTVAVNIVVTRTADNEILTGLSYSEYNVVYDDSYIVSLSATNYIYKETNNATGNVFKADENYVVDLTDYTIDANGEVTVNIDAYPATYTGTVTVSAYDPSSPMTWAYTVAGSVANGESGALVLTATGSHANGTSAGSIKGRRITFNVYSSDGTLIGSSYTLIAERSESPLTGSTIITLAGGTLETGDVTIVITNVSGYGT